MGNESVDMLGTYKIRGNEFIHSIVSSISMCRRLGGQFVLHLGRTGWVI